MGIFNYWPYSNIHEMNLGWVIRILKEMDGKIDDFDKDLIQYVNEWLDSHPEATTTVMDGAVSYEKLDENLKDYVKFWITNRDELDYAVNYGEHKVYFLTEFEVDEPVEIKNSRRCADITLIGGKINTVSSIFTNPSIATATVSHATPNFIGTVFEGTGAIHSAGFYTILANYVQCTFNNISFIKGSKCVQTHRFINCKFISSQNTPFINTNALYDVKFYGCDFEGNYKPTLINVERDITWGDTITSNTENLDFIDCTNESRNNPLVRKGWGSCSFTNLYTEANTSPVVLIYDQASTPRHSTTFVNCYLRANSPDTPIVQMDYNYSSVALNTSFNAIGCVLNNCLLVNRNTFRIYNTDGCRVINGARILPSNTISRIQENVDGEYTNGLAYYKAGSNTIKVKSVNNMVMLNYMVGQQPYIVIVGKSSPAYGNVPFAICVNNPSLDFSPTYDSANDMIELTLPSGTFQTNYNMTAIDLGGIIQNTQKNIAYRGVSISGYTPEQYGNNY